MDKWTDEQIHRMANGGNKRARGFFSTRADFINAKSVKERYTSDSAQLYRQQLQGQDAPGPIRAKEPRVESGPEHPECDRCQMYEDHSKREVDLIQGAFSSISSGFSMLSGFIGEGAKKAIGGASDLGHRISQNLSKDFELGKSLASAFAESDPSGPGTGSTRKPSSFERPARPRRSKEDDWDDWN